MCDIKKIQNEDDIKKSRLRMISTLIVEPCLPTNPNYTTSYPLLKSFSINEGYWSPFFLKAFLFECWSFLLEVVLCCVPPDWIQVECLHIVGTENLLARVCDPVGGTQKTWQAIGCGLKKNNSWNIWGDVLNCSTKKNSRMRFGTMGFG